MTDQRLRELLDDRVADLIPIDLVDGAWERASAVRRRRHAVAGAAVAVVAVVGTTTVVVSGRGDEAPPPPTTSSTESPVSVPKAERSGKYGGVPVWWAPSTDEEADLPHLTGSGLPERIDLADTEGEVPTATRAVGLFQLWGEQPGAVVVVGADGASYSLDVSRLEPVTDAGGEESPPVSQESLSPDGRHALFAQERSLEVYDFEQATWTTIPTARWAAGSAEWTDDGEIGVPVLTSSAGWSTLYAPTGEPAGDTQGRDLYTGPRLGEDDFYGPIKRSERGGARGLNLAGPLTDADGTDVQSIEAVGAGGEHEPAAVLAFPPYSILENGRWNQCCPAVGWLDQNTVLFESRHENARILAWRVGTGDLYRVSDIRGWTPGEESYVASFADPSVPPADDRVGLPTAERGPSYGGASIWWAPPAEDETGLPWLGDSPLPQRIDLSEGLPALPTGLRGVGVFDVASRVVVLAEDAATYSFATDHLDSVADESGNAIDSLGDVSPDGRRVFFVQRSSLEVYDFVAGAWSTIDTPDWLAEGAVWFGNERIWVPDVLGSAGGTVHSLSGGAEPATFSRVDDLWVAPGGQAVLPAMDNGDAAPYAEMVAQDYVVSESMTRPDGSSAGGAHVLHVGQPGADWGVGLAYPFIDGERGLGSVAVLDWATPTQVLYWSASTSTGRRILAWDPGTRWLARVSELTGITARDPVGSSFADLTAPGD